MPTECTAYSQPGTGRSNPQGEAWEGESVSRNTCELDSASLRLLGVAKLPEMLKPDAAGEVTFACNQRTPRGGWRRRIEKGMQRNLGGPCRPRRAAGESDDPIVAKKDLTRLEPRGSTVIVQPWKTDAAA